MKWKMSGMREKQKGPLHLIYVPCQGWQWPLCMITSDEQISPPSLVCKENSLHLHSFCVDILFKFTALGHSFMQNFATLQFKTRLGGEICSFDVNMHKGYFILYLAWFSRDSFHSPKQESLLAGYFVLITNHTSFFATKIEKFLVNAKITVSCHINPLSPKSDQHQASPCNINAL